MRYMHYIDGIKRKGETVEALYAEAGGAERNSDAEEEADRWRLTGALS